MTSCVVIVVAVLGCGGSSSPPPTHAVTRPRATMAWDTGDECLPRHQQSDPCVRLSSADASAMRDAILARLRETNDMPDVGLVLELAERPIAQWTANAYQFEATSAPGHPGEAVELSASEHVDSATIAGFRCLLVRADGAWAVLELAPFAAM
jgi:hypothetical protein